MNFVSKISLRFDDHTVSSFLHQYGRSKREQSTQASDTKSSSSGRREKNPFGVIAAWQQGTTAEMAAGAYSLMAQRQFFHCNGEAVTESLQVLLCELVGNVAWLENMKLGSTTPQKQYYLKQPNNQNLWALFALTLKYAVIFMGSCSRMLCLSRSHRAIGVFCSLVCEFNRNCKSCKEVIRNIFLFSLLRHEVCSNGGKSVGETSYFADREMLHCYFCMLKFFVIQRDPMESNQ